MALKEDCVYFKTIIIEVNNLGDRETKYHPTPRCTKGKIIACACDPNCKSYEGRIF